jgi:hypothetical protein
MVIAPALSVHVILAFAALAFIGPWRESEITTRDVNELMPKRPTAAARSNRARTGIEISSRQHAQ